MKLIWNSHNYNKSFWGEYHRINSKKWILELDTINTGIDPLMGWETSRDTMSEVKLEFTTKNQAINYAKKK